MKAVSASPNPLQEGKPERPTSGRLLVVTIDRLPAWMLAAWGATWVSTPAIDGLAADGVAFDRLLTPSLDPRAVLATVSSAGELWRRVAAAGWQAAIVTDDPSLPQREPGVDLVEVPRRASETLAADDSATNIGRLVQAARELMAAGRHRLIWMHAGSLAASWDAPEAYRGIYLDPDDPPPPAGSSLPRFDVDRDTDPDRIMGARQVFAGQLTLLDRCLGGLFAEAKDGAAGPHGVLFIGLRGMPLGLHGLVGCGPEDSDPGQPFGEWAHLPGILVDPGGRMAGQRCGGLTTPADLADILLDLVPPKAGFPSPTPGPAAKLFDEWAFPGRDRILIDAGASAAIVTPDWHLVVDRPGREDHRLPRLYAKPDDFFELCDVADRCPAIVEELESMLKSDCFQR